MAIQPFTTVVDLPKNWCLMRASSMFYIRRYCVLLGTAALKVYSYFVEPEPFVSDSYFSNWDTERGRVCLLNALFPIPQPHTPSFYKDDEILVLKGESYLYRRLCLWNCMHKVSVV